MHVVDLVKEHYKLPIEPYPFQRDAIDALACLDKTGWWLDMGTGKTFCSIVSALYKLITGDIKHTIVLMPPILLTNWSRTLASIPGVTHTIYRGTPTHRKTLDMRKHFILMSYDIFKRDYYEIMANYFLRETCLICDESTALKNVKTQTYKRVRDWAEESKIMLLSGSPLSSPMDAYSPIKIISPSVYRSLTMFENIHVAERDFFKKPTKWQNLDLLSENLMLSSCRVLKTDVLKDLPSITYTPLYYDLDAGHKRTYDRLAEEQLLRMKDGTKIDATSVSALFQALQQIPLNRSHFMQEDGDAAGVDLIEELMTELEPDGKLAVFTAYRMSNRMLLQRFAKYGAVGIYGEISAADQIKAIDRFVDDKTCRIIFLQLRSAGFGIDKLQNVCSDVLFIEMPLVAAHFHQACARVWRAGQANPVNVRVAIAEGTIQDRLWKVLQDKDSLTNLCIRGYDDLKEVVSGN